MPPPKRAIDCTPPPQFRSSRSQLFRRAACVPPARKSILVLQFGLRYSLYSQFEYNSYYTMYEDIAEIWNLLWDRLPRQL